MNDMNDKLARARAEMQGVLERIDDYADKQGNVRVLLRNDLRTPRGRFRRSVNGVPTLIPAFVIRAHGLPSAAKVVGADYKTPEESRAFEDAEEYVKGRLSPSEQEARIEREVNRRIKEAEKKAAAERDAKNLEKIHEVYGGENTEVSDDGDGEDDTEGLLDLSVKEIVGRLQDMDYDQLKDLLKSEGEGKARKSLMIEIEAAITDFD
jgi:hypothetical protein